MMRRSEGGALWAVGLPGWVQDVLAAHPPPWPDDDTRMALAVALARGNLAAGDGGPFGAAVFDTATGELITPGVNLVLATNSAIAHAEMAALTLAQHRTELDDLGRRPTLTLVTSAEPCAMCLGALPWTGIRRVVIGARDADIRAAGFDEGAKPAGWVEALAARGITTVRDIRRAQAAQVLADYAAAGGVIYGGSA